MPPFKFFIIDEEDVYIQPTLINNYEYVRLQIEHSKDLFCNKIILRLLTDLETILLDRSRAENQTVY